MLTRKFMMKPSREQVRKKRFEVPSQGGVLQRVKQDNDGNVPLKLAKKIKLTSDTYIFRFSFPDPEWTFGLPVGNHVVFNATIPTKEKL
jgi:hypothetical protein